MGGAPITVPSLAGFLCALSGGFSLVFFARRHSSLSLRLTVGTRLFDVATPVGWCLYASYAVSVPPVCLHASWCLHHTGRLCPVARCPDRCTLRCACASWCLYSSQRLHASFCRLVFTRLLVSSCLLRSPRLLPAVCLHTYLA